MRQETFELLLPLNLYIKGVTIIYSFKVGGCTHIETNLQKLLAEQYIKPLAGDNTYIYISWGSPNRGVARISIDYTGYMLTMLGILDDTPKTLNTAEDIINSRVSAHDPDLLQLGMHKVTLNDRRNALSLIAYFNKSGVEKYTIEQLKTLTVVGDTTAMGVRRLDILEKLNSDVHFLLTHENEMPKLQATSYF